MTTWTVRGARGSGRPERLRHDSARRVRRKRAGGRRGAPRRRRLAIRPRRARGMWRRCPGAAAGGGSPCRSRPCRPGPAPESRVACPLWRALVSTVDRGVDGEGPSHRAHRIVAHLDVGQQLGPRTVRLPAGEPLMAGLPRPVALGDIAPRSPGPPPQHAVDHLRVITPRTATPVHLRRQGLSPLPHGVRQLTSTRHKIICQAGLRHRRDGCSAGGRFVPVRRARPSYGRVR